MTCTSMLAFARQLDDSAKRINDQKKNSRDACLLALRVLYSFQQKSIDEWIGTRHALDARDGWTWNHESMTLGAASDQCLMYHSPNGIGIFKPSSLSHIV